MWCVLCGIPALYAPFIASVLFPTWFCYTLFLGYGVGFKTVAYCGNKTSWKYADVKLTWLDEWNLILCVCGWVGEGGGRGDTVSLASKSAGKFYTVTWILTGLRGSVTHRICGYLPTSTATVLGTLSWKHLLHFVTTRRKYKLNLKFVELRKSSYLI